MTSADPEAATNDHLYGGGLSLRQPARGHRAGTDAVLLAASARVAPGERVADFGAGVGTVGLMLATRCPGIALTLVEIDPVLSTLAADNALRNGIAAQVLTADLAETPLPADAFDHVVMNPPFHPEGSRPSPDPRTARARMGHAGLVTAWIAAARHALRGGGVLTMIHRPDALPDILAGLSAGFGSGVLVPVQPSVSAPAMRILIAAVKGAKGPLVLERPLALNGPEGRFTGEADALHRGTPLDRAWPVPRPLRRGRPSADQR